VAAFYAESYKQKLGNPIVRNSFEYCCFPFPRSFPFESLRIFSRISRSNHILGHFAIIPKGKCCNMQLSNRQSSMYLEISNFYNPLSYKKLP